MVLNIICVRFEISIFFRQKIRKSIFAKISRTSLARRILVFNFIPFGFSERTGKTKTTSARDYFWFFMKNFWIFFYRPTLRVHQARCFMRESRDRNFELFCRFGPNFRIFRFLASKVLLCQRGSFRPTNCMLIAYFRLWVIFILVL